MQTRDNADISFREIFFLIWVGATLFQGSFPAFLKEIWISNAQQKYVLKTKYK